MDNLNLKKYIKSNKLNTFSRNRLSYKFRDTDNINKLKKLEYSILKKKTKFPNKSGKVNTYKGLNKGDFIFCGPKGDKYGLSLEEVLKNYDIGDIKNKKIERKGFKLSSKNLKKMGIKSGNIKIKASWGSEQNLKTNDFILLENGGKGIYGIANNSFKKTYTKSK